jgi:hypothetical protein
MSMEAQDKKKKKPYRPPQVRSERLVVADLFSPSCVPDPETGTC